MGILKAIHKRKKVLLCLFVSKKIVWYLDLIHNNFEFEGHES